MSLGYLAVIGTSQKVLITFLLFQARGMTCIGLAMLGVLLVVEQGRLFQARMIDDRTGHSCLARTSCCRATAVMWANSVAVEFS